MEKRIYLRCFCRAAAFVVAFLCSGQIFAQDRASDTRQTKTETDAVRVAAPESLFVEDFNVTAGTLLTNFGWAAHSGGGTNPIIVTSPGLTFTGYPSSGVGNAATITTSGEDDNKNFPVQSAGSVYVAFMVNASEAAIDPVGGYFFHLGPDPIGTTFRGRVFIKKDASNNISFGIAKAASTVVTDIVFTPFSFSLNTTYLLIVKYTIVTGVTNDTVALFVNPVLGGVEPAPAISASDVATSDINPGSVALRQGTAATHPTARLDGIRVSNTWASLLTAPPAVRNDFNGDGRTDYAVTRNSGALKTWWIQNNGNPGSSVVQFGLATDFVAPADYDGDNKTDFAVWREGPAAQARFFIFQSTTSTVRIDTFGQTGDRPTSVGDYDGDGKADVSVYRAGATVGAQSTFFYRGSLTPGNVTYVPWGRNGDVQTSGDFDGDGKFDVCVRRDGGGGQGLFILRRSSDSTVEFVNWGLSTDAIIPGDYDGDGKSDFAVARPTGNNYGLYILERDGGGTGASPILFGLVAGNDLAAFGDYDGDGKQDIAIWRENADPTMNFFWVRQSSSGAVTTFEWGQLGDETLGEWNLTGGN